MAASVASTLPRATMALKLEEVRYDSPGFHRNLELPPLRALDDFAVESAIVAAYCAAHAFAAR